MEKSVIFKEVEKNGAWGMSDFQSRYFVVHSQVTKYRRVRQGLLEIETRIAAKKQIERNTKKTKIEIQIKQREILAEKDELKRALLEVDVEQFEYDLSVYDKKYRVVQEELDKFAEIILQMVPDVKTLETYKEHDEDEERKYWITRMGKQACIDMVTTGRIGPGNLDSIAMMNLDDQVSTIKTALKYSAHLSNGIKALEEEVNAELAAGGTRPSFIALDAVIAEIKPLLVEKIKGLNLEDF